MSLTTKQQRFVEEYVVDFNATQAAIRAGYSEQAARQTASENLSKPNIARAVAELTQKATRATQLTREMVIDGLLDIATNGRSESARARSWELLGKHLGMFTDRLEVTQITKDGLQAEIERLEEALAHN